MAINGLNYAEEPTTEIQTRLTRIKTADANIIDAGSYNVLFGATEFDYVIIFVYDARGTFISQIKLAAGDKAITRTTVVDESNADSIELVNIDCASAFSRSGILPGRYSIVFNFLRADISTPFAYDMFISEISNNRSEIKLTTNSTNPAVLKQIEEFVNPSVPKLYAQALLAQSFGESTDALPGESINFDSLLTTEEQMRVDKVELHSNMDAFFHTSRQLIYQRALDLMAADITDNNVQEKQLIDYVDEAINQVTFELVEAGQLDKRVNII